MLRYTYIYVFRNMLYDFPRDIDIRIFKIDTNRTNSSMIVCSLCFTSSHMYEKNIENYCLVRGRLFGLSGRLVGGI